MNDPTSHHTGIDKRRFRLDQLCDDFEQKWANQERPRLESVLQTLQEDDDHESIFRELLLVEIEVRMRLGEQPSVNEYTDRFADRTSIVRDVLQHAADSASTIIPPDSDSTHVSGSTAVNWASMTERGPSTKTQLPGYSLIGELGRGGMGVVYKARQEKLNRVVALKTIRTGDLASAEEIKRFLAEAEAAAKLDHPSIVPIHEIAEHDGLYFFSMGFVDGPSLKQKLADGVFDPRAAAELVRQLAEAVQYAHDRGIVHRDLKPANILLSTNDQPRIADFGLAKQVEADSSMTATGQALGTPSFMPPEQASGDIPRIGPHSDVYSLGAILYALLTGRPPFQAANAIETMKQVVEQEPISPRQLNSSVDKDLETICLKCLQKEPEGRYDSAQQLADDLQRFLRNEPIAARPASRAERVWRWCRRKPAQAIAIVAMLVAFGTSIAFGAGYSLYQQLQDSNALLEEQRDTIAKEKNTAIDAKKRAEVAKITEETARKQAERLRDERSNRIAVMTYGDMVRQSWNQWLIGNTKNARRTLESTDPSRRGIEYHYANRIFNRSHQTFRGHTRGVQCVAWSEGGQRVVTGDGGSLLRVWNIKTRNSVRLNGHKKRVTSVAISPDGKLVASGSRDRTVIIWDAEFGQRKFQLSGHPSEVHQVRFSPDGKRLFACSSRVLAWDLEPWLSGKDQQPSEIKKEWFNGDAYKVWCNPDGERVVTLELAKHPVLKVWDSKQIKVLQSLPGISRSVGDCLFHPDGHTVFFSTSGFRANRIQSWDMTTGQLKTVAMDSARIEAMAFNKRGTIIVWADNKGVLHGLNIKTERREFLWQGHERGINSIIYSPADDQIATVGNDNTLRIWNVQSKQKASFLRGHLSSLSTATFSGDGKHILTADNSGFVKVWNSVDRKQLLSMRAHPTMISDLAVSPNGKSFVTASWDRTAKIWDMTGQLRITLKGHKGIVHSAVYDSDGTRIVTASADKTIRIWDVDSGQLIRTLSGHESAVMCAVFSPDGQSIVSGSSLYRIPKEPLAPGEIRIWHVESGECQRTIHAHEGWIQSIAFHPNGRQFACGSMDGAISIWNLDSGEQARTLSGHSNGVSSVAFSLNGRRILSGSLDGTIVFWDTTTGTQLLSLRSPDTFPESTTITKVAFGPNGRYFLSVGQPGFVAAVWDAQPAPEFLTLPAREGEVPQIDISSDGSTIVGGSREGRVRVFDIDRRRDTKLLRGHESTVMTVAFSPDGQWIASGGFHKRESKPGNLKGDLRLWNLKTVKSKWAMTEPAGIVRCLTFTPDGRYIICGLIGGMVRIRKTEDGTVLRSIKAHVGYVSSLAISPDGTRFVTGGNDKKVCIWRIRDGKKMHEIDAHDHDVYSVAFSPDGERIASSDGVADLKKRIFVKGEIKIWSAKTGKRIRTMLGHSLPVWTVAFSPDGKHLVSGSVDYRLIVWDVATGQQLATLDGHTAEIRCAKFSPDGQWIVSCSGDKTIKVWDWRRQLKKQTSTSDSDQ